MMGYLNEGHVSTRFVQFVTDECFRTEQAGTRFVQFVADECLQNRTGRHKVYPVCG